MKKNEVMTVEVLKDEAARLGDELGNQFGSWKRDFLVEQLAVVLGCKPEELKNKYKNKGGYVNAIVEQVKTAKEETKPVEEEQPGQEKAQQSITEEQVQPEEQQEQQATTKAVDNTSTENVVEAPVKETDDVVILTDTDKVDALNKVFTVMSSGWHKDGKELKTVRAAKLEDVYAVLSEDVYKALENENFIKVFTLDEDVAYAFNVKQAKEFCTKVKTPVQQVQIKKTAPVQTAPKADVPVQEEKKYLLNKDDVKEYYTTLKNWRALYLPTRLHGELGKFNGKYLTMKLAKARGAMAVVVSKKLKCSQNDVGTENINKGMKELVERGLIKEEAVTDAKGKTVVQYFITNAANIFMKENGFCKKDENFFTK